MQELKLKRKHQTLYQFTALGSELVSAGYDDAGARRLTVIGSKHLPQQEQAAALRDYYSYSRCTHDYDCCGVLAYVCPSHTEGSRAFQRVSPRLSQLLRSHPCPTTSPQAT